MFEERTVGTNPLIETRREAHEKVNKQKRYMQIQNILSDYPDGLTAKEISVEMKKRGYAATDERNLSAPRLNELSKLGIVDCIGKKKCQYSGKSVGVFTLRHMCELCGQEIGDFNDNGIYEGKYCEECFNEAEESRM